MTVNEQENNENEARTRHIDWDARPRDFETAFRALPEDIRQDVHEGRLRELDEVNPLEIERHLFMATRSLPEELRGEVEGHADELRDFVAMLLHGIREIQQNQRSEEQ